MLLICLTYYRWSFFSHKTPLGVPESIRKKKISVAKQNCFLARGLQAPKYVFANASVALLPVRCSSSKSFLAEPSKLWFQVVGKAVDRLKLFLVKVFWAEIWRAAVLIGQTSWPFSSFQPTRLQIREVMLMKLSPAIYTIIRQRKGVEEQHDQTTLSQTLKTHVKQKQILEKVRRR